MPDVTLIIDGQTVTVPAGTNIVDAARATEVAIPVFCYHPKLKPVGMCRMCLVEVWTPLVDPATRQPVLNPDGTPKLGLMMGKLQPGCVTPVAAGMVVKTVTDKVQFAQRGQLEFLLSSHPLDCPVCDKGGECPLQNLTMQFGPSTSRYDYQDKVHFEKPIPLGDTIYLDRERCILCSRCVRFQDDIAGDPVLGFDSRGRSWEIISKSDPPFDSKFSGNTTDICPVGALTSSDFRFKARVWEVRPAPVVCTHCPVGCNITLDMRHDRLMRVMPRENDFVNEIWNCDKGRYGMRYAEDAARLTTPLVRRGGQLVPATWDEALRVAAQGLMRVRSSAGAAALAGMITADAANEDFALFHHVMHGTLGTPHLDHRPGGPADVALETASARFGVSSGTNLLNLGTGTLVLLVGADPEEEAPLYVLRLRGIVARGGQLVTVNAHPTKLDGSAARVVRVAPGREAALLQAMVCGILDDGAPMGVRARGIDRLRASLKGASAVQLAAAAGVEFEAVRMLTDQLISTPNLVIMIGRTGLAQGSAVSDAAGALAAVTGAFGRPGSGVIALHPGGNARGAQDLGIVPGEGGLAAAQYWDAIARGELKGLLVAGLDPAALGAASASALDALDFLVVQDTFLSETARRADVVLPCATLAERDGTFTNAERRVQRSRQARQAPDGQRAHWQILQGIAAALGSDPGYSVSSDITDAIAVRVPAYAGARYTSLGVTSGNWGRQANESVYYDGTSYTNTEGTGVQLPTGAERDGLPPVAAPLTPLTDSVPTRTQAVLVPRAYDGRDWARGSKLAPRMVPPHVIVGPADASTLGIGVGEPVTLTSARGSATLPAQIDRGLAAGTVLIVDVAGFAAADLCDGVVTSVTIARGEA
jgi:NADH-quinone oxidoreductase subunit G